MLNTIIYLNTSLTPVERRRTDSGRKLRPFSLPKRRQKRSISRHIFISLCNLVLNPRWTKNIPHFISFSNPPILNHLPHFIAQNLSIIFSHRVHIRVEPFQILNSLNHKSNFNLISNIQT